MNASLRRTLSSKERELQAYVRRLQGMQTVVGDLVNNWMVLDRLKSEKRDLADQLDSAKSSRVELNKKPRNSSQTKGRGISV